MTPNQVEKGFKSLGLSCKKISGGLLGAIFFEKLF